MLKLLVTLFCCFWVLSPDPLPMIIDDVIIAIIAIKLWAD